MPKKRYKKKGKRSYGYGSKSKSYRAKSRKSGRTKTNMNSGKSSVTYRPIISKELKDRYLRRADEAYQEGIINKSQREQYKKDLRDEFKRLESQTKLKIKI